MILPLTDILILCALGLSAGLLGGLTGLGGSIILIPMLVLLWGQGEVDPRFHQHLYQAAAMIINVLVAGASTYRHARNNGIDWSIVRQMLPTTVIMIIVGVYLSNQPLFTAGWGDTSGPVILGRLMTIMIGYTIIINLIRLIRPTITEEIIQHPTDLTASSPTIKRWRIQLTGSLMGLFGGLLGIGGGTIAVPLQQIWLKRPLRRAIANSAAIMCFSSLIGAFYKNITLNELGIPLAHSLTLAACLGPTAIAGAYFGSKLTHQLPVRFTQAVLIIFLIAAALKMAHL